MTSNPYRSRRRLRRVMVSTALLSGVGLDRSGTSHATTRPAAVGPPSSRTDRSSSGTETSAIGLADPKLPVAA